MQSYLLLGPTPTSIDSSPSLTHTPNRDLPIGPLAWPHRRGRSTSRRLRSPVVTSATDSRHQNHYAVLGVSPDASSADIKKAYRALALKCDTQPGELPRRTQRATKKNLKYLAEGMHV